MRGKYGIVRIDENVIVNCISSDIIYIELQNLKGEPENLLTRPHLPVPVVRALMKELEMVLEGLDDLH